MPDISVGSVSVDIVPDATGFRQELAAKLKGIGVQIAVSADLTHLREQLAEATRTRMATINANADTTAAEAQLDAVARDRTANIDVDKSGSLGRAASGASGLLTAALLLGPALVPVTAAVTGLAAALTAPLAAAGGGLTVFGLIAGAAVAKTLKQQKAIGDLAKKVQSAQTALSAASTASGRSSAQERLALATKAYQTALKQLTPEQRKFQQSLLGLKTAFGTLVTTAGPAIFGPLVTGMDLLSGILPKLEPVLNAVAGALTNVMTAASKSGAIDGFLKFLAGAAGPAIEGIARGLGNLAVGFAGLALAFKPVTDQVVGGLTSLTQSFAEFGRTAGSNKGLQSFIGYVRDVGPLVAATLGSIIGAIVHLGVALAPIGPLVLGGIKILADVIQVIPTGVLTVLATVIGTVVVGLKAWGIAQSTVVVGLKAWGIAQSILNTVMAANPIALVVLAIVGLVAGLVLAYKHSETFRNVVNAAFNAVKTVAGAAINFIKDHWRLLIIGLTGLIGVAVVVIVSNFGRIRSIAVGAFKAVGNAGQAMWGVLKAAFKFIVDAFLAVAGAIVHGAAKAFSWVPGIGGKLKGAAAAFDRFRDDVNRSLSGIHDKTVTIKIQTRGRVPTTAELMNNPSLGKGPVTGPQARASGGPVSAGGTYLVGEMGPELLTVANGGYVTNSRDTRRMLSGDAATAALVAQIARLERAINNVNTPAKREDQAALLARAMNQAGAKIARQR